MANRQKSHFGSDGYKELYAKEKAAKQPKSKGNKEIGRLRKEDAVKKKKSSRSSKFIVPRGSGHTTALGRQNP